VPAQAEIVDLSQKCTTDDSDITSSNINNVALVQVSNSACFKLDYFMSGYFF